MKTAKIIIFCSLVFSCLNGKAQINLNCSTNSNFRNELYIEVYKQSIAHTFQILSLSSDAIYASLSANGITPYLDHFLRGSSTSAELDGCFGRSAHFSFVQRLLLVDAVGKAVGIAAGISVGLRIGTFSSAALNFIMKPVAKISPILGKSLIRVTPITLAGLGLYSSKIEYDRKLTLSEKNGEKLIYQLSEKLKNINAQAARLYDTEADIQFDLSVSKAEVIEGRSLTEYEILLFCQVIPNAKQRCNK